MGRLYTTLFLVFWYLMFGIVGMAGENWVTRILILIISLPVLLFALYLIWIDSKLPANQQFRFYNSRWGKNERNR